MMTYIISYDIKKDKKRNKISKILEEYGQRLQYSVFICQVPKKELYNILLRMNPIIDKNTDSILIIPINLSKMEIIGTVKIDILTNNDNYIL
ncbi:MULTISPECIES: CRISPR-associated endonuclease Cas2 [unclassified Thermosipho (in: thermotogales)]|uniref:CRISPR-associated endonuclease Cas2 n=1 Tax=unclassified Thermosipho (in: thermotogales) TaxID=2676525 RepID=UPI000951D5F4|nr:MULTISPECIES: CRISPR-associated endonuclease Cas2 [unclassified Thermosipho (in: thermotogales)]